MKRDLGHFVKMTLVAGCAFGGNMLGALPAYASEGHGGGGLPQMDATQYPGLLFWLAICFSLLFLMMHLWIVPQIQDAQGNRRGILDTDLTAARIAQEKSQDMMSKYEKALADARTNAAVTVDAIVNQYMKESEDRGNQQQLELQKRLDDAHARIEKARQEALRDVPKTADELVETIVAKFIGSKKAA